MLIMELFFLYWLLIIPGFVMKNAFGMVGRHLQTFDNASQLQKGQISCLVLLTHSILGAVNAAATKQTILLEHMASGFLLYKRPLLSEGEGLK